MLYAKKVAAILFSGILALCFALAISGWDQHPAAYALQNEPFLNDGGDGSSADTAYLISTAAQLKAFADYVNSGNSMPGEFITLTEDIDLAAYSAGIGWTPIGCSGALGGFDTFAGTFDGGEHIVSNLIINADYNFYESGLFGVLTGSVKNLAVINYAIGVNSGVSRPIGAVAGLIQGIIENCLAVGTVSGRDCGGIAGYNTGRISDCISISNVSAQYNGGGISWFNEGTIERCSASGSVTTPTTLTQYMSYTGGIAGDNGGIIRNCYNTSVVIGSKNVGGIAGMNYGYGSIRNCYNTGMVMGVQSIGGIVGFSYGTLASSYYLYGELAEVTAVDAEGTMFLVPLADITSKSLADWDFDAADWDILSGRTLPFLKTFDTAIIVPHRYQMAMGEAWEAPEELEYLATGLDGFFAWDFQGVGGIELVETPTVESPAGTIPYYTTLISLSGHQVILDYSVPFVIADPVAPVEAAPETPPEEPDDKTPLYITVGIGAVSGAIIGLAICMAVHSSKKKDKKPADCPHRFRK